MSYFPSIPQPDDIPADSQDEFLTNYGTLNEEFGINHIPFGNTVTSATLANPSVITSVNHRLITGDTVTFYHMFGINTNVGRIPWPDTINGVNFAITKIDDDSFSIPLDTSSFDPYEASSGNYLVTSAYSYGFHTKLNIPNALLNSPNLVSPKSSIYTKVIEKTYVRGKFPNFTNEVISSIELFFQNANSGEKQLTNNNMIPKFQGTQGLTLPWGVILNFNFATVGGQNQTVFSYAVPYTTTNYFTIATYRTESENPATSNDIRVTSSTLADFTVNRRPGAVFSFFSMGV